MSIHNTISNYTSRIRNGISHLAAAGFGLDAVNNVANGNYDMAAIEALISAYIEISTYFRKHEASFYNSIVPQLAAKAKELAKGSSDVVVRFQELFKILDEQRLMLVTASSKQPETIEDLLLQPINYSGKQFKLSYLDNFHR